MARKFLIDIGLNDTLENVIRKVNYNFRLISGDTEKQTSLIVNDATQAIQTELNNKADIVDLSGVAFSGSYTDLSDKPNLSSVAVSGDYTDLLNTPNLATVATSGDYNDLSNNPNLATVATSGDYNDLINAPTPSPGSVVDTAIDATSINPVQNMAIANALSSKVNKSGDVLAGEFEIDGNKLILQSSNIDRDGADPAGTIDGNAFLYFTDEDGELIGLVCPRRYSDGRQTLILQTTNETSNGDVANYIMLHTAKDGTRSYDVADAPAFREAINALSSVNVNHTGEDLDDQVAGECWWGNNMTNAPDGSTGYFLAFRISSLQVAYRHMANGGEIYVWARNYMNNTWGTWTQLDSRLNSNSTISGIITASSGITIEDADYAARGGVATLRIKFKRTATGTGSFNIGTIVAGKRPAIASYGDTNSTYLTYSYLTTGGTLLCYANHATSASTEYGISLTYVLA